VQGAESVRKTVVKTTCGEMEISLPYHSSTRHLDSDVE